MHRTLNHRRLAICCEKNLLYPIIKKDLQLISTLKATNITCHLHCLDTAMKGKRNYLDITFDLNELKELRNLHSTRYRTDTTIMATARLVLCSFQERRSVFPESAAQLKDFPKIQTLL